MPHRWPRGQDELRRGDGERNHGHAIAATLVDGVLVAQCCFASSQGHPADAESV